MGAVRMLARGELRRQWKSVVVLTLLVGVVGALVLASVAGARRTATALERFRETTLAADVEIRVGDVTAEQLREFRRVDGVAAAAELRQLTMFPTRGDVALAGAVDTRFARVVDRARVVRGRLADPSAPLEVEIGESLADDLGLDAGEWMTFESFTPEQVEQVFADDTFPDPGGPLVALKVVGIVRRPLDLGVRGADGGVLVPTPAFVREYRTRIGSFNGSLLRVRTDDGSADLPRVVAAARRIFGVGPQAVLPLGIETEGARDAIDVLTVALWVFAGVAALGGTVTVGIVLARRVAQAAVDQSTLRALGLTRRRRATVAAATAVPIAAGGAALAVLGAVLLSARLPMGLARRAEPDLGFHVDRLVFVGGVALVVGSVLGLAAVAAWRVTRLGLDDGAAARRSSYVARTAARLGAQPPLTAGLRMALEPGRGRTAVPVRSALAGASVGVLGVVAVLTFASSLDSLVTTPRLWGGTWDVSVYDNRATRDDPGDCGEVKTRLTSEPLLDAVGAVCRYTVELDGRSTSAFGFTPLSGRFEPLTVVTGRAPQRADEVALGATTLDALGKDTGDSVRVAGPGGTARARIVGVAVMPTLDESQPLADGAAFTGAGLRRLEDLDQSSGEWFVVARFASGVDPASGVPRVDRIPDIDVIDLVRLPLEIDRLRQVDDLPTVLAGLMAFLAVIAVGHALVSAVRRRRRDLAILKTLGCSRGQVRAAVAWQATTLAVVGLLFGIPLGLVVGRAVWGVVADSLGVATDATIPVLAVLVIVPVSTALANLVAAFPARSAARTRPAVVLRSE